MRTEGERGRAETRQFSFEGNAEISSRSTLQFVQFLAGLEMSEVETGDDARIRFRFRVHIFGVSRQSRFSVHTCTSPLCFSVR